MLKRLDELVVRLNELVLVALMIVMAAVVFSNVMSRGLTGQSFGWGAELARQLLVWMVMMSVGLVLRRGGHLALTLLFTALPGTLAMWAKSLVLLLVIAFASYSVWAGVGYTVLGQGQSSPVIGVPYSYIYAAIPTGFALLIYHALASWKEFVTSTDEFQSVRSSVS